MEVLASIVGGAVVETGRLICGSYANIKNFIRFQSNQIALEKEMKSLLDLKYKVREELDSADTRTREWLREAEQIMIEVNSIQEAKTANNEKLCGCFLNCSKRCRLSQEMARMLKEARRLVKAGNFAAKMVGENYMAKPVEYIPAPSIEDLKVEHIPAPSIENEKVEHIPTPSIENQTTASKYLVKLTNLVNDDDVRRIGVWGMGGVGKTTLLQNLNNKLKSTSSMQSFSMVIWATVSKDLDLKRVQIQIAERLNLEVRMQESVERLAVRLHQRLQKENKFLIILDDVWETLDLDSLGVPQPEIHTGSKIILTSRSLEVCRGMKTDEEVKVDVLNDEEAWKLFGRNAGKVITLEHIEPLARAVAKECGGLPLAIITVGTAMRGKTMVELWKDALSELRRSVPYITGIENKVYKPLKWSYDSLQGKNIKPCFLHCCLYPEDFSIEVSELVNCWLAEGLIDEQQNYEESHNRGIAIIENLKDSCLLERGVHDGTVKMHDVVRDVAIWISSSLEDGCRSLVRSGVGLTKIPELEMSESLKRISFMNNKITGIPDHGIHCPEAWTLLLQGNLPLEIIPDGFFQAFQSLRFLNVSRTHIKSLPQSVLQLTDLRVLLLRDCVYLEELPRLGRLSKLRVLDCCATRIRELPGGMEKLRNLRQLDLSRTYDLKTIHSGVISSLSSLEVLDMTLSAYIWRVEQEEQDGQTTFKELGCLEQLLVLSIRLYGIPSLDSGDLTWINRLRQFQFFVSPSASYLQNKIDGRRVTISRLNYSGEQIDPLLTNASSLVLHQCLALNQMLKNLAINSTSSFAGLKSLSIDSCPCSFSPAGGYAAKLDLLPNLEELHLHHLMHLNSISELVAYLGLRFSRLRILEVTHCHHLDHVLPYGDSMLNTEVLEVIKVSFCDGLDELFRYVPEETEVPISVSIPNLRIIELKELKALTTICKHGVSWPSLEQLEVIHCSGLTKLPLTEQHANTIKEIRANIFWWRELLWENDRTAVSLQSYINHVSDYK